MTSNQPARSRIRNTKRRPQILVVSSDPSMARLVQYIIHREGAYRVELAYDLDAAVQKIAGASYQFLIYDSDKPADTRKLQRLKRSWCNRTDRLTRILAMTTYGPSDVEFKGFMETFDACLSKPFTRCQLMQAIALMTE